MMEIPERAVKSWRCNTNAASGASPAPVATSADEEKKLPAAKPESALSAIKIEIEIMDRSHWRIGTIRGQIMARVQTEGNLGEKNLWVLHLGHSRCPLRRIHPCGERGRGASPGTASARVNSAKSALYTTGPRDRLAKALDGQVMDIGVASALI
jgi:hypothetical protein